MASISLEYYVMLAKHRQPHWEENQIRKQKNIKCVLGKRWKSMKHWGGETELWLTVDLFSTCKCLTVVLQQGRITVACAENKQGLSRHDGSMDSNFIHDWDDWENREFKERLSWNSPKSFICLNFFINARVVLLTQMNFHATFGLFVYLALTVRSSALPFTSQNPQSLLPPPSNYLNSSEVCKYHPWKRETIQRCTNREATR